MTTQSERPRRQGRTFHDFRALRRARPATTKAGESGAPSAPLKGRTWSAEETLAIVLEGITGATPVAESGREPQIAQTQYDHWRNLSAVPGTGRSLPGWRPAGMMKADTVGLACWSVHGMLS